MATTVTTNAFTNPSFEAAGAVEVARTNYQVNPKGTLATTGWTGLGTRTATSLGLQIDLTASTTTGAILYNDTGTTSTSGEPWSDSFQVTVPTGYPAVTVQAKVNSYGSSSVQYAGDAATIQPGETKTITASIAALPTGNTSVRSAIYASGTGAPSGARMIVTRMLLVKQATPGVYFDGSGGTDPDRIYAWTGTANASTSTESVTRVAGVTGGIRSAQWSSQGTYSLRVDTGTAAIPISASSTVIITARNAGQTINGVAGVAGVNRVTGVTSLSLGVGYWDQLAIVAGNYTGDYFDGNTPDTLDTVYAWTGTVNASTSTKTVTTADYQLPAGESVWSVGRRYLWFGNGHEQKWLPMPSSGIQVNSSFAVSGGALANGGQYVRRSRGYSRSFEFNFEIRDASGYNGLEQYGRFASDAYGLDVYDRAPEDELFYFCDPMVMKRNVLPPQWATPGLCRYSTDGRGFHDIAPARVSDVPVATPSNSRGLPDGTINWNVALANIGAILPDDLARHTARVLIPPTHRLHLGFTGTMTGSAAIMVRQHLRAGGYTDSTVTALIDPSSANGLGSLAVDGQTVAYVTIWLGRLTGTEGTIQLYGAMGQLWPRWETPDMTTGGKFTEGLGHGGLEFSDEAIVEQYVVADQGGANGAIRYLKGMNTTLAEVGPWR